MRWLSASTLSLLSCISSYSLLAAADAGVDPPGLVPLITRGNVLLSSGHFADAAKAYSDAIEQSPNDYLLYYKRATAYLSLQRHASALEDLDKVLSMTGNSMDGAWISKARVHAKEGNFGLAKHALAAYVKAKGNAADEQAQELETEITEADRLVHKADRERRAQLWPACVESSSAALRIASHSVELRTWRAECALAEGDIESTVADMTRLGHLLNPSTQLLARIFRLSYFLTPPSPASLNTLKECFHFDPDSKLCHKLHKLAKGLDRSFTKLDNLLERKDWRGIAKLLLTTDDRKAGDLWRRWEEALLENTAKTDNLFPLIPPELASSTSVAQLNATTDSGKKTKLPPPPPIPLPLATKISPQRQKLVRSLCQAYVHLADNAPSSKDYKAQMSKWCEELLTLKDCQEDLWGLIGRGESLLAKEEYEDAMRAFERAFEASGRSDAGVQRRYTKAQRLLKQSKQKDYYKILGVARDADAKTIKKAFRNAAKTAHPDKGGSEEKMAAINEAYEVLSNPETRARFDNGEDPNDPSGGQPHYGGFYPGGGFGGPGGNPFASFFQGGGGGFQFTQSQGHGGQRAGGGGPFQFHFGH